MDPIATDTTPLIPQSDSPISKTTSSATLDPTSNTTTLPRKSTSTTTSEIHKQKSAYIKSIIHSLVHWENPIASAIVLGGILGGNYLLAHYSPIRVLALVFGTVTFANLVFVNGWVYGASLFVHADKDGGVRKPPTMWFLDNANRQPLSHSLVRDWSDFIVDTVNVAVSSLASLVAVDDNKKSAEALFATGLLYLLSSYISSTTLFILFTLSSFTLPLIYKHNKTLIDTHANNVHAQASVHVNRATSVVGTYWNSAAEQTKRKIAEASKKGKAAVGKAGDAARGVGKKAE
ncbi:Reticulon-domain-containing protein [Fimicolochytrium jonesii]|uniref:Reticulon-domain-containing protein n=1 Tax=Fimicolochytrium jonesii TaxID=1396493 RepID=UPI0022FE7FC4|nr:Reticulon-domain-containing protein [Fimicolochytrium jonesii]KAI8824878.1 Reticulon-domain-containing protein [Fimicolochytrium jonesii]